MTTVWIGRCGGVVRHGSLRQAQGRLTMNVNGGPGAGVPGNWGWKRAVREPPLRAMGTARTGANVNLGGRVAVGCVVRHGPPGTAPRLTTNGWAARGWVARGRGRSETGPHVRQDGRRGSCRGGLGAAGRCFDTAQRVRRAGTPRTVRGRDCWVATGRRAGWGRGYGEGESGEGRGVREDGE